MGPCVGKRGRLNHGKGSQAAGQGSRLEIAKEVMWLGSLASPTEQEGLGVRHLPEARGRMVRVGILAKLMWVLGELDFTRKCTGGPSRSFRNLAKV